MNFQLQLPLHGDAGLLEQMAVSPDIAASQAPDPPLHEHSAREVSPPPPAGLARTCLLDPFSST